MNSESLHGAEDLSDQLLDSNEEKEFQEESASSDQSSEQTTSSGLTIRIPISCNTERKREQNRRCPANMTEQQRQLRRKQDYYRDYYLRHRTQKLKAAKNRYRLKKKEKQLAIKKLNIKVRL